MNHKSLLSNALALVLVALLLVACSDSRHLAVQRVEAYHKAINAIKPARGTGDGNINLTKGLAAMERINAEHTTMSGTYMDMFHMALMSGVVEFKNMEYELISEGTGCAVVKATGELTSGDEAEPFEEEYVVIEQDGKWLIGVGPHVRCR